MILNTLYNTRPGVIHANGSRPNRPNPKWEEIKRAAFARPREALGGSGEVTVITVNNGMPGLLEQHLMHRGVPYVFGGRDVRSWEWVNAVHKPTAILTVLATLSTAYTLFADSYDTLLLQSPDEILHRFQVAFPGVFMLFGAETNNFPNEPDLKAFEEAIGPIGPFRYLNAGCWIGKTAFAERFFRRVIDTAPVPSVPWSEQGRIRKAWPEFFGEIVLDYECRIFQNNASRLAAPYLEIVQ